MLSALGGEGNGRLTHHAPILCFLRGTAYFTAFEGWGCSRESRADHGSCGHRRPGVVKLIGVSEKRPVPDLCAARGGIGCCAVNLRRMPRNAIVARLGPASLYGRSEGLRALPPATG